MKPWLIGIAGPSGSGKTELANGLVRRLPAGSALAFGLDSYYRDLAATDPRRRDEWNFDHPDALDREVLLDHLTELSRGRRVTRPAYSFATHTRRGRGECTEPRDTIIVDGLFALYWPEIRALLGTKVFIEASDDVCLARRIARDTRERGRTAESVRRQYETSVRPMYRRYVAPTRAFADVVVDGEEPLETSVEAVVQRLEGHTRTE